jgi:WD40 repeat protein
MTTFMPPPPAATFLAFHPQDNNIIAIGMDDSTIQIYNVRIDEVLALNKQDWLCFPPPWNRI